jgi:hypothetical protein
MGELQKKIHAEQPTVHAPAQTEAVALSGCMLGILVDGFFIAFSEDEYPANSGMPASCL